MVDYLFQNELFDAFFPSFATPEATHFGYKKIF